MDTKGYHLLVEYHGCDADLLDDRPFVEALLERAAKAAGATRVGSLFHRFSPQGVTGVLAVEESHLSIHTWPESGYAAVDVYTCGQCDPEAAHRVIFDGLGSSRAEVMLISRGLSGGESGIEPTRHWIDTAEPSRLAKSA